VRDAPLEIHVYPGRDCAFRLYEDDGDGYGYEDGAFATVDITWEDAARRLVIGERVGMFPGMTGEQELILTLHEGAVAAGGAPGSPRPVKTMRLRYAGEAVSVQW
jgi:alpha-D-xyloside xylohydrolase